MKHFRHLLGVAAVAVTTLTACGTNDTTGEVTIVTSFYPATWVAERVAGDHATITPLTRPGVEAHDLELTGQQVASVQEADAVVYLSGFQPAVDDAITATSNAVTVDLATGVEPLDQDHDQGDPHVWLDPRNLKEPARALAEVLGEARPELADEFMANAESVIAELDGLHTEFETGLTTCETRTFVTSHAAFGHLAAAHDLEQVPIAGLDPSAEPSSAALARVIAEVNAADVTTVFTERLGTNALADTVARETRVETAVLDPIEGLTEETAQEDYLSLMRQNLEALRLANDCS